MTLCGTVAPGDYKHYVLPLPFLRYLSLGYEQRHQQIDLLLKDLLCLLTQQEFIDHTETVSDGTRMPRVNWEMMAK